MSTLLAMKKTLLVMKKILTISKTRFFTQWSVPTVLSDFAISQRGVREAPRKDFRCSTGILP